MSHFCKSATTEQLPHARGLPITSRLRRFRLDRETPCRRYLPNLAHQDSASSRPSRCMILYHFPCDMYGECFGGTRGDVTPNSVQSSSSADPVRPGAWNSSCTSRRSTASFRCRSRAKAIPEQATWLLVGSLDEFISLSLGFTAPAFPSVGSAVSQGCWVECAQAPAATMRAVPAVSLGVLGLR